ncbi:hypothetical protein [Neisseria animalis]|uniref:Excinuclease ABC subunit A n=1 Tax=Neisseria animalis TaxID=492 RepID=A0A5P3MU01_NEIAN|nr:hypothetical protein [Neisseria animalis]QEY24241.1 hypothetical protein D0T90_06865 [Neisseria animalis]ROW32354.1 hypothetical protein CGZ60_05830 [Neisseria animalis]VEE06595.1 Uncharacterised protein [Neisseria animalis]
MKKFIFTLCIAGIAGNALANEAAVNLVQRMYGEAAKGRAGIEVVAKYADSGLKQAIRRADASDMLCVGEDPMWGNQDPQTRAKVTVKSAGGNKVSASFKQYGQNVRRSYTVNCKGGSCKVSDVSGLKRELAQCY